MAKYKKWIILAVIGALLAGIAVMAFGYLVPYLRAGSTMDAGGEFVIQEQADGSLRLTWPAAKGADYYCIELLVPAASEEEAARVVYRDYITEACGCIMPELPLGTELMLRVSSVVEYSTLGQKRIRFGDAALEVTTVFDAPVIEELTWNADPDANTVSISVQMKAGDICRMYLPNENGEAARTEYLDGGQRTLTFGDGGDLPVPQFGQQYSLVFDACREITGLKFYGYPREKITVERDHLLGRNLNVELTDEGENVFSLNWDETKGEYYEIQLFDQSSLQWVTVFTVAGDGERTYTSSHMGACQQITCRVVAVGGETMEESEYAAISDEITFTTQESSIFATIWPVKELEAYSDPQKTEAVGTVSAATAYCVLEEKDGMFAIRLNDAVCYIDSNYCMINLPEYMGQMCSYEITNSYSSLYMVHEFEIPKVTGVVTAGYEHVRLADGSYLAPLLYPTAQKLVTAARSAMEQGYRLKIYDSYRPNKATREIYDLTESILDDKLPKKTYTGVSTSSLNLPTPAEGTELTYRDVMTSGTYGLNYFLAKGGSLHNLGIALDLTLEDLYTGEEVQMQTSIHDLSRYSILSRNNEAAKTLAGIMKGAGFGDLVSEWWHFQDNDARANLSLPTVYGGISAEGWVADDNGSKYRRPSGDCYVNETVTIGGTAYTFDENGYVTE